jgi:hypothetical protein
MRLACGWDLHSYTAFSSCNFKEGEIPSLALQVQSQTILGVSQVMHTNNLNCWMIIIIIPYLKICYIRTMHQPTRTISNSSPRLSWSYASQYFVIFWAHHNKASKNVENNDQSHFCLTARTHLLSLCVMNPNQIWEITSHWQIRIKFCILIKRERRRVPDLSNKL